MDSDTCYLTIRIPPSHQAAVVEAFGVEPAERHDFDDRRLCVLGFDHVEPHGPLGALARQGITFDGSHGDSAVYPGRLFAAQGGELAAIDQPFGVVSVPIDLDSLAVDELAFSGLRAYQRLRARAQEDFDNQPPLDVPLPACRLEEVGDEEPWHRLLGLISIGGLRCHVEAVALQYPPHEHYSQEALAGDRVRPFALLSEAFATGSGFQTLRHQGSDGQDHHYAIFIYPYDR
ncbi:MAG TPA: hypothetical protein VMW75_01535 [Thermoanaerobaculia bacterium]|nr:hypothetical protein [Thermoanaerobaculia bacterium]